MLQKKHTITLFVFLGILCILSVFIMNLKEGFYIDEYYTYTLSNGTHLGISVEDGAWNDTNPFEEELVTTKDVRFNFKQTCKNTADDVHPPVYYILLHSLCSFFPGIFSKWFALSINLVCFLCCLILLYKISMLLSDNHTFSLLFLLVYAINPSTLSGLVYLRMYFLLSVFACAYVYIHLKMVKEERIAPIHFVMLPIIGFLGFLTHYYMLFVMFSFSLLFALFFFFYKKKYIKTILYGCDIVASLILSYFVWPVSIFHMFKGYRGKGAAESLTDIGGLPARIAFFAKTINSKVFSHLLPIVLFVSVILLLVNIKKNRFFKEKSFEQRFLLLYALAGTLLYLLPVSCTALKNNYSNRYMFPLECLLIFYALFALWKTSCLFLPKERTHALSLLLIFLTMSALGIFQKDIDYFYPEHTKIISEIENNGSDKAIVFQKGNYDSVIGDFILFDQVYFSGEEIPQQKTLADIEEFISSSPQNLIYIENGRDMDEINELLSHFPSKKNLQEVGSSGEFYTLYRFY